MAVKNEDDDPELDEDEGEDDD